MSKKKQKISSQKVMQMLGDNARYLMFLFGLSLLTIMNSHLAEKKIRKITTLKKEVKELNWKYLTLKSQWMNDASLSNLEDDLDENKIGKEGAKPLIIKDKKKKIGRASCR